MEGFAFFPILTHSLTSFLALFISYEEYLKVIGIIYRIMNLIFLLKMTQMSFFDLEIRKLRKRREEKRREEKKKKNEKFFYFIFRDHNGAQRRSKGREGRGALWGRDWRRRVKR